MAVPLFLKVLSFSTFTLGLLFVVVNLFVEPNYSLAMYIGAVVITSLGAVFKIKDKTIIEWIIIALPW